MADVFMPRLSDTMEEGAIAQWLKAEGDTIERGDILAEVETDKAVMDLEAYDGGVLEKILIQPGQTVPIGEVLAIIGDGSGPREAAADISESPEKVAAEPAPAAAKQAPEPAAKTQEATAEASEPPATPAPATATAGGPLKASPVVRSLAKTHNIDLSQVTGTGPEGRIIRVDVEQLIASGSAPTAASMAPAAAPEALAPAAPIAMGEGDERIPLSMIRKVTAKRLSEAALVPAFQLTTIVDATGLNALRQQINDSLESSGQRVSVTDLLVKACAVALREHPEVNAAFDGDAIIRRGRVNVGIAVALEDGLIVPVVKDADKKTLSAISVEAKDLAKRAREGKLTPEEFSGGTFTISNLGMFGIDNFTAVLNPPEAAILAVGSTVDEPVVIDGEVQVRPRTRLTLTVDHRVLDGAMGAAFLRDLTDLLAEPLRLLV